eukprot:jgi/Hompol1/1431/HPOL_002700-RA
MLCSSVLAAAAAAIASPVLAATQKFTLNLSQFTASPDGYQANVMGVNNVMQYPIIVNKGDDLQITVNNRLGVPTSMHYHGIFQTGTPYYDGASGITQCPIASGTSLRYDFSIPSQHGTYWYHAHHKSQYVKGIRGPLIVQDPANEPYTADYDEEKIVMFTDWFHTATSDQLLTSFLENTDGTGQEPVPDSGLINGKGRYNCSMALDKTVPCNSNAPLERFDFVAGKRYRLRIINAGSMATFNFSIDGHKLTVIEADGVDTVKTVVDVLPIRVAQRYSVIVTANATAGNYWLRADIDPNLYTVWHPETLNPAVRAIVSYTNSDADPTTKPVANPTVLDQFKLLPYKQTALPTKIDKFISMRFAIVPDANNFNKSSAYVSVDGTNITSSVWKMPTGLPAIVNATHGGSGVFDPSLNLVKLNSSAVVEITVYNDDPMEHTFHLHGGINPGTAAVVYPERDTVAVPPCKRKAGLGGEEGVCGNTKGFVTIKFLTNNPGLWLFHCHIEWHMAQGLAVTLATGDISGMRLPPRILDGCRASGIQTNAPQYWLPPRTDL